MALSHPLNASEFANKLRIQTVRWWLQEYQESSMTGGGDFLVADLAPRLWRADVTLIRMSHDDAAEVQALIESLDGSINAFNLYDPRNRYPRADPNGTMIAGSTPIISSLSSNNKVLEISDLPAGYKLSGGDMFFFPYGSGTQRLALHRIVSPVTANGAGVASGVEVRPHFRPGVATGIALDFTSPVARMRIVPGSFEPGTARRNITEGMSFQAQQVI
ncbi:hypothetical protein OCK02_19440 [Rhizobium sp. TRM96647]|uniref:hypothetical protein n=1 Tax=unclassified Rhizobium TaxID=2613769 RepID=UPI0021E87B55|nr:MULTISPECIES: hypothetical protein [unclassified Rhizobium]MCV3738384.1 hypothetical protein [Rhizobium sp. TRM96647]MCV3759867.1 hypothetical protein [Rhizobium sp. TRM96650]